MICYDQQQSGTDTERVLWHQAAEFLLETVKFVLLKTYLLVSHVSAVLPLTILHSCGTFDITLKTINRLQAVYSLWNSGDLAL